MACRKRRRAERNYCQHPTKDARIKLMIVSTTTAHTLDTYFTDKLGNAFGNPRHVFGIAG